ncbi:MAG: hypothetical protein CMH59_12670, partial [Myxococcales bacterium]|nr:hypothetical protein [Myxococcales bacterium]
SEPPPGASEVVRVSQVVGLRRSERPAPPPEAPSKPAEAPSLSASAPERRRVAKPQSPRLKKLRGPLTARRAVELLGEAEDRDEILEIGFAFARQFFDFLALFVVHEEEAEGLDAVGEGADHEEIRRLAVDLSRPGAFATVREGAVPLITHLDQTDEDRDVRDALDREEAMPAVLVPVSIRQRVVLVFYGDRAGEDFGLAEVPELLGFTPRMSEAFQKLILRQKFRGYAEGTATTDGEEPEEGSAPAKPSTLRPEPLASAPAPAEAAPVEADAPADSSPADAAPADSAPVDSGPVDSGPVDSGPVDTAPVDTAPVDSAPVEAAPASSWSKESIAAADSWGDLTEAEKAARASSPPSEPRPGRSPSIGPARKKRPRKRSKAFQVLGVPRSAPPPPMPGAMPEVGASGEPVGDVEEPEEPDAAGSNGAAGPARPAEAAVAGEDPASAEAPPEEADEGAAAGGPGDEDEPELAAEASGEPGDEDEPEVEVAAAEPAGDEDEDDDEPEIEIEEADAADFEGLEEEPASAYRMRGVVDEVVVPPRRHDPRREDPSEAPPVDVVRGVTPSASPASRVVHPPSSQPTSSVPPGELPSIIIEVDENVEALVSELRRVGPDDEMNTVRAVMALGEIALPVLVRDFPGPLWFDRHRPHRRLPRGRDVSAIARTLVAYGDRAVPYLATLLDAEDTDARFYAVLVARERPHRDLVAPLGRRIFDADPEIGVLALDVLREMRRFDAEIAQVVQMLRATARVPRRTAEQRGRAARALGELRDQRSLELLVDLLAAREDALVDAAHAALVVLTRQDFGKSRRKWLDWVEANVERHRIEWLIEALLHGDEELRRAAGEELKHLTQEYYGYHPSLPKKDREVAQRKYLRWWETEGQARFLGEGG